MSEKFDNSEKFDPSKTVPDWEQRPEEWKKQYMEQYNKIHNMPDNDQVIRDQVYPEPDDEMKKQKEKMAELLDEQNNKPLTDAGQSAISGEHNTQDSDNGE